MSFLAHKNLIVACWGSTIKFLLVLFGPTTMALISDIIIRAADQHQRNANGEFEEQQSQAKAAATKIREQISEHLLERAVADVAIDGTSTTNTTGEGEQDGGNAGSTCREEVTAAILSLLNSSLTTVYLGTADGKKKKKATNKTNKKKQKDAEAAGEDNEEAEMEEEMPANDTEAVVGEWSESVDSILRLVAALGCSTDHADESVARALMDRAVLLSDVAPDAVRSYVCTFVGLCVHHLCQASTANMSTNATEDGSGGTSFLRSTQSNDDMVDDDDWRIDCLDKAGSILLPRLTDKAQAVRCAAIKACSAFFVDATNGSTSENEDETEDESSLSEIRETILDALLGRMAHDPSFANRCAAIQSVPITKDTVPYLMERVGDVKEKVRVAALDVMRYRVDVVEDMTEEQRVDVLRFGLTSRCVSTHNATAAMLCGGWMKTLKFDPIALLRLLDPINDESVCNTAMRTVIGAATNEDTLHACLSHLSSPEVRAYRESVFDAIKVEREDDPIEGGEDAPLDAATAFYLRVVCEYTKDSTTMSASEKNEVLGNLLPDVPALCGVVQKHLGRLVGAIRISASKNDEEEDDNEEEAAQFEEDQVFICLQLLQLVKCADLQEEGSRRHLVSILYAMLTSQETPDDLVETCIRSMALAHDTENQFLQTVSEVIDEIKDQSVTVDGETFDEDDDDASNENNQNNLCQIRILSILSIVLEQVSGSINSMGLLDTFSDSIVAAVTTNNNLVREAGVSCLGKYALLMSDSKVVAEFKPLLLQVASSKSERVEVRAQALLALCDLALLFDGVLGPNAAPSSTADEEEETNDVSFVFLLSEMLCHSNSAVVVIAAEVAAKLLFAGKLNDHPSLAAHLVAIFFDSDLLKSNTDEDSDEVKEIGNPVRLQQILSLFFPAFCIRSKEGRTVLMNCIKPLLSIVGERQSKKKRGKKATAWPIAKMVEYVCSNVDLGEEEEAKKIEAAKGDDGDEKEEGETNPSMPSSTLLVSIAISEFLTESSVGCTTTYLRAICKIIGGADIILEEEPYESLSILKKSMDEAAMVVTDNTSIRSLETLLELLEEVPDEEEEDEDDEDDEGEDELDDEVDEEAAVVAQELADELEKTNLSDIDPAGEEEGEENITDTMEEGKPSNNTSNGNERRQLGELNA